MRAGDSVGDPRPDAVTGGRQHEALARLVGEAPTFRKAIANLPQVAVSGANVLVTGETGTGKELVARALHLLSPRASLPFVAVNCGAFADGLLHDELFGHERGAFTDAKSERSGVITEAKGGTLLLDEFDSLPSPGQVALLRVLEEDTFRPLGSNALKQLDVRFIAATNVPIFDFELLERKDFRHDLYFRIAGFCLHLPPLRERRDDILLLTHHFLAKQPHLHRPTPRLRPEAEATLQSYDWPGNVRELKNVIIRATSLARGGEIGCEELQLDLLKNSQGNRKCECDARNQRVSFKEQKRLVLAEWERSYLIHLLQEQQGNVTKAAQVAATSRRVLQKLLSKHSIDPGGFRKPR